MDSIAQDIRVAFRYPVAFTVDLFAAANPLFRSVVAGGASRVPASLVFVVDDGVVRAHPDLAANIERYVQQHGDALRLAAPILVIPGGEQAKNDPQHVHQIHQTIHAAALCRHSYVVAVGGGAVLDVAGYAAATAHRGIRLIRVPTTVLSQDDSAVGVKNGINAFGVKNYYGTFAAPFAVLNDLAFLPTLEDRDWLGGVSEAVKAALVRDAAFFDELEQLAPRLVARDLSAMERVVRRSAALHLSHIAGGGDPFETGSPRPLDFGHWAAHKLEQLTGHALRHGEAVGIGVALDSTYSYLCGFLPEADWTRIINLLIGLRLSIFAPELADHVNEPGHPRSVLRGLEEFREHLGGELTVLLLRSIGRAFDVHEIDRNAMIRSIEALRRMAAAGSAAAGRDEVLLSAPAKD